MVFGTNGLKEHKIRVGLVTSVAAFGLWLSPAKALDTTALSLKTTQDLYGVCTDQAGDPQQHEALDLCEGFIAGAIAYHDAVSDQEHLKRLVCYPTTATRDDGIQAFTDWGGRNQQNQKYMGEPAVMGVVRALASKWPCK
jgi:hypothetical protein